MKLYALAAIASLTIAALFISSTSNKRPIFIAPTFIAKEFQ
jgi:hypothetical protein